MFLFQNEKSGIHEVRFLEVFLAVRHVVSRWEIGIKVWENLMICLLTVERICNLVWSSPEVQQFSQPTIIPNYSRGCRPVKISYFRLCSTVYTIKKWTKYQYEGSYYKQNTHYNWTKTNQLQTSSQFYINTYQSSDRHQNVNAIGAEHVQTTVLNLCGDLCDMQSTYSMLANQ